MNMDNFDCKMVHKPKIDSIIKKTHDANDFTMQAPLSVLSLERSPIPGVWPLHGSVIRAQNYHFSGEGPHAFPPPGMLLEVGIYKKPLTMEDIGKLEMLNLQRLLFAWILSFQHAAKAAGATDIVTDPSLDGWRSSFGNVVMHFVHIAGGTVEQQSQRKTIMVYGLLESEEKSAEDIGHSPLMRGRELTHLMESARQSGLTGSAQDVETMLSNIKWAREDTTMHVMNIRLHLRVLRRLSTAVKDPLHPAHIDSALCWFERNEEVFGRKTVSTSIQESPRFLDAFCTALPDSNMLQEAAENLHIALLRGHVVKGGKNVADWARALET